MLDIHLVSHTHWDREWYLTHEQFRLRLIDLIDRLLDLLEADPSYRHFHLDGQTIVLEDYLEIRPEQRPRLKRAIEEGRILVGPWYVMPDEFLVSGEALIRNLARGHRISREFGRPMRVGYLPDLFGHVGQMPQIWRQFGIDNAILWRGFGGLGAEYWWDAPDGSRVLMLHLPREGYCNATRLVFDPGAMLARAARAVANERGRTCVGQVLLMNGVDHVEPHAAIPMLVERLSSVPGQRACHSTLPDYVGAVRTAIDATHPDLDTIVGELRGGTEYANLLPGVLSARLHLKQQNAHVQTLLESYAEPLSVFASLVGKRYPAGELQHAWRTLLQNHPHDSICGCSIDAVHEENRIRFARAAQVAEAIVERALDRISDSVAPASAGAIRAVVVNPDAVERMQVVEAVVDLPVDSAEPWRRVDAQALDRPVAFWPPDAPIVEIVAPDGEPVPFQLLREQRIVSQVMSRFETPWALNVRRVHLLWWAPALPPCGYAAFDLKIGDGAVRAGAYTAPGVAATERAAENDRLRLAVNDAGTFDVTDKTTGVTYRHVASLEDVGDVGDEYNYCPPQSDRRVTTSDARVVEVARVAAGPLRAAFRVDLELPLPVAADPGRRGRSAGTVWMPVSIEAALDAAAPRVVFTVSLHNLARDHRLRALFPTGAAQVDVARADTAFDVVTRPARQRVPEAIRNEAPVSSAPLVSLVDAGDGKVGATVIAKGLTEYEIVAVGDEGPAIALTLVRAVGDLSRNDLATRPSGHAGPPVATPGAQCPGRHRFEIAFEPHGSPPSAGALVGRARAQRIPPRVVTARRHDGTGAAIRSFLRVAHRSGAPVLSALKKADDRETVVVRLFNPEDEAASLALAVDGRDARGFALNFLEERLQELAAESGAVTVRLKPHEVRTIELDAGLFRLSGP
jgi:mannosylglycerate hydrolase